MRSKQNFVEAHVFRQALFQWIPQRSPCAAWFCTSHSPKILDSSNGWFWRKHSPINLDDCLTCDFQFYDETQKRCILKTVTSTLKRDTCRCLCWVARAKFDWFISSYWCIVLVRFVHLVRPCPTTTEQSC